MRKGIKELSVEEKEYCNVRIEMPHYNISKLNGYEPYINRQTPKEKLKFLFKTLYNTKHIKKTLDMRKLQKLERSQTIKEWNA